MPRTPVDIVTIGLLFLTSFQQAGTIVLFIPLSLMVLFLAANAQTSSNIRRSLGLFSYGLSRKELLLGQYSKGILISTLGILSFQIVRSWMEPVHIQSFLFVAIPTILLGGLVYMFPIVRQLRSREFLGLLKN